jgi:DTW domain-containing protein YfiP
MSAFSLEEHSTITLEKKIIDRSKGKCEHCFLFFEYCICRQVKDIFNTPNRLLENHVHIALYMHFKEYGRASNTGKLLRIGSPTNTSQYIYGQTDQEESLQTLLQSKPSLIIYPSPISRPISEYAHWLSSSSSSTHHPITLCVIDSTWPQSRAMEQRLHPDIPRVHIDELVTKPSLFLNRKQSTNKTKISTIEAIMLAIMALIAPLNTYQTDNDNNDHSNQQHPEQQQELDHRRELTQVTTAENNSLTPSTASFQLTTPVNRNLSSVKQR